MRPAPAWVPYMETPLRYCLNVHGEMLCDAPRHHDGGCTFTPGWQLVRRLEDDLLSMVTYAGDTTNELRDTREDRDEGWRQHNRAELRIALLEDVLGQIAASKRPDGTYNLGREACEQLARKGLDGTYGL